MIKLGVWVIPGCHHCETVSASKLLFLVLSVNSGPSQTYCLLELHFLFGKSKMISLEIESVSVSVTLIYKRFLNRSLESNCIQCRRKQPCAKLIFWPHRVFWMLSPMDSMFGTLFYHGRYLVADWLFTFKTVPNLLPNSKHSQSNTPWWMPSIGLRPQVGGLSAAAFWTLAPNKPSLQPCSSSSYRVGLPRHSQTSFDVGTASSAGQSWK